MYKLVNNPITNETLGVLRLSDNATIPFDPANTDYQTFKYQVLNQQPGNLIEDGDSFSIDANPNLSILEDADGVQMTIDEAKVYVRTLP